MVVNNKNLSLSVLAAAILCSPVAGAVDYTWLNTAPNDPNYNDAVNWATGVVPGVSDRAIFDGADSDVWFQSDVTNSDAQFRSGNFTLDLNSHQWTLNAGIDGFVVGQGGAATLNIGDGTVETFSISTIGVDAGSTGTVNVGAGGVLNTFATVGSSGTGTLNVYDGGQVYGPQSIQGFIWVAKNARSSGTVNVDGAGSSVILGSQSATQVAGALFGIGRRSIADLNVTNGGHFRSHGISLGEGELSNSTIIVNSGASLLSTSNLYLARGDRANATATLRDSGTTVTVQSRLDVGENGGQGTINVFDGASLHTGAASNFVDFDAYVGGNNGTVNVSGAGSTWRQDADALLGFVQSGTLSPDSSATLNVSDGALVDIAKSLDVGATAGKTSYVNVDNAQLVAGNRLYLGFGDGAASLEVGHGGAVTAQVLFMTGNADARVGGAGSRLDATSDFSNRGNFTADSQGVLTVAGLYSAEGNSLLRVDGAGSEANLTEVFLSDTTVDLRNNARMTVSGDYLAGKYSTLASSTSISSGAELNIAGSLRFRHAGNTMTLNNGTLGAANIWLEYAGTELNVEGDGGPTAVASSITGNVENNGTVIVRSSAVANFNSNFLNNNTVNIESGSTAVFAGTVSGSGDFTGLGDAVINGVLAPGNSPGLMSFEGDVAFGSASIFQAELAGNTLGLEYDSVSIGGTAMLDGTLEVLFIDGYSATPGRFFDLLVADTIVGQFETTILPDLGVEGWYWDTQYILDDFGVDRLRLTAVPVPGAVWLFGSGLLGLLGWRRRSLQTARS